MQRPQSTRAGWRSRLSVLASTLAMSSAINGWVAASASADTTTTPAAMTTLVGPAGSGTNVTSLGATTVGVPVPTTPAVPSLTAVPPPTPTTPAVPPPTTPAVPTTATPAVPTTAAKPTAVPTPPLTPTTAATPTPTQAPTLATSPARSAKPHPPRKRKKASPTKRTQGQEGSDGPDPSTSGSPSTAPQSVASAVPSVDTAALGTLGQVIGNADLPPSNLIPIYKAAGARYQIPWQVLAAINGIETDYGRNLSVSSAGAIGWMQFMPATWSEYAVPVGGQGTPNPYNPRDAIFAAAHLLAANGGAHDLRQAIFAYNHASWYVDAVLWREQLITDWSAKRQRTSSSGYALPLDGTYMSQLGRTDEGVDIETAPDGAAVYSMTAGVVTAVASDPTGFGPNYPVIHVTSGPLAGHYIYYGHVAASLVQVGQQVTAGQPIAVMGHTGDAAGLGHGHIEIGFSDTNGNPLNHPGTAPTPSGTAMRSFLIELSAALGIHNS